MSDTEQQYNELLTLIRNLSNEHVPKEYRDILSAVQEVKELTKAIWKSHHFKLLQDLQLLSENTYHDIQQFWFECLSYPYGYPIKKGHDGKNTSCNYYNLPSEFNEIGFHDSRIIKIKVTQDIEITIDHVEEWEEEDKGWKQVGRRKKLHFQNGEISAYTFLKDRTRQDIDLSAIDFPNNEILDFWEIPAINYFKDIERITCDYCKMVFKMDSTADGYSQIFIVSDNWHIEPISDDSRAINYAFKTNK